jgi:hypothetical protein
VGRLENIPKAATSGRRISMNTNELPDVSTIRDLLRITEVAVMREANQIQFTGEEKKRLAQAITKAACGIAECWDTLRLIGERIGSDWEPSETSVSDIADQNAADIDNPAALEALDDDSVAVYFADPVNWQEQSGKSWVAWQLSPDSDADERWILVNAVDHGEEHPAQVIFESEEDALFFLKAA